MARDTTSRHFWMCAQRDTCLCAQGLVSRLLIEVLSMTMEGYSLCILSGRMATTYIKCYLHMAQRYMAAQKTQSETLADQISKSIQWKKWVATWYHMQKTVNSGICTSTYKKMWKNTLQISMWRKGEGSYVFTQWTKGTLGLSAGLLKSLRL